MSTAVSSAVTGVQVVYDRHHLKKKLTDHYITAQAYRKIYFENDRYKNTQVSISTLNRIVLLTGQIPSQQKRDEIEQIVRKIPNIQELYNLTTLSAPSSKLTEVSDAWITAKIKTKFIASEEIDPSQIKVITENGTVYLLGIIPPSQAKAAIQIARTTAGVQNVVKIFAYVKISKTL